MGIAAVTNAVPYFVGKTNSLMMRTALRMLGVHSEDAVIVGDRMERDIVGGIESGMDTIARYLKALPHCWVVC